MTEGPVATCRRCGIELGMNAPVARLLGLLVLIPPLLACEKETPRVTETVAVASVPQAGGSTVVSEPSPAPAAARYDEEAFEVLLHAPTTAKAGEPIPVSVVLVAKAGFKVNPEYPIKFAFESSADLVAEPAVLRKEQGTLEKGKAELRGVVTLRTPGARAVGGKLSFSVCTDERCLIEKRDLSVTVNAASGG